MIKRQTLPKGITTRLSMLPPVLARQGNVVFAYLFGGLARGEQRPLSDVDIAVYLGEVDSVAEVKLEMIGLLTDALGSDEVDLVILNQAPVSLVGRILNQRQVIVDKDPALRHLFESRLSRGGWTGRCWAGRDVVELHDFSLGNSLWGCKVANMAPVSHVKLSFMDNFQPTSPDNSFQYADEIPV